MQAQDDLSRKALRVISCLVGGLALLGFILIQFRSRKQLEFPLKLELLEYPSEIICSNINTFMEVRQIQSQLELFENLRQNYPSIEQQSKDIITNLQELAQEQQNQIQYLQNVEQLESELNECSKRIKESKFTILKYNKEKAELNNKDNPLNVTILRSQTQLHDAHEDYNNIFNEIETIRKEIERVKAQIIYIQNMLDAPHSPQKIQERINLLMQYIARNKTELNSFKMQQDSLQATKQAKDHLLNEIQKDVNTGNILQRNLEMFQDFLEKSEIGPQQKISDFLQSFETLLDRRVEILKQLQYERNPKQREINQQILSESLDYQKQFLNLITEMKQNLKVDCAVEKCFSDVPFDQLAIADLIRLRQAQQAHVMEKNQQLIQLKGELELISTQLATWRQQIKDLEYQILQMDIEINKLLGVLKNGKSKEDLESDLRNLQTRLAQLYTSRDQANINKKETEQLINTLQKEITDLEKQYYDKFQSILQALSYNEKLLRTYIKSCVGHQKKYVKEKAILDQKLEYLNGNKAHINQQISKLEELLQDTSRSIGIGQVTTWSKSDL